MDYNSARMSQQFRSQSQPNGGRGKQQQNDSDALLRLVCRIYLCGLITLADCSVFPLARPRNRRMHQRHWRTILSRGPPKAQPAADSEDLRMVCGIAHECDTGDGGTGYARCGRGRVWGTFGDCAAGHEEFDGLLRVVAETAR